MLAPKPRIAVVIPCYRVSAQILQVLARIGSQAESIIVVDDGCPEHTARVVREGCADPRVRVIAHAQNRGVGAAMVTGYRAALADGADIVVKLDGDGQMDPREMGRLTAPLCARAADYTKGNRFFDFELLDQMPRVRLFGNALLSLVNKLSSGYWNVMDPTNGYTAIHRTALSRVPLDRLSRDYFFESDMLFRLYTIRAVVHDIPMPARYADETSNLRIRRVLTSFPGRYLAATLKRVFYSYFLRDFNAGTLQLVLGFLLIAGGALFGIGEWFHSVITDIPATSGTVMLAALPVLIGVQLILGWLNFDIQNVPAKALAASELETPMLAFDAMSDTVATNVTGATTSTRETPARRLEHR